jgi:molybdopterin-guanine dinucleotide biosynthesis protein A
MGYDRLPSPDPEQLPEGLCGVPAEWTGMRSGIVLVGGEARRADGMEKYFFEYQGMRFIDRLILSLSRVVDEIILVAKDPEQCRRFAGLPGICCVHDIRKGIGPIGGLHAGALAAQGDLLFVSACDMPCVSSDVIEFLFEAIDDYDAAIPAWEEDMIEPLHAVYRRAPLLVYLEDHDSLSLRNMVRNIRARFIPVAEIRKIDPSLTTFTNVNRLSDLHKINHQE